MSEVKIYTIESVQLSPPIAGEGFCVDLVLATEYQKLKEALDVQSARSDALAAENATLKSGGTYFAYSPEYGFDYFKDKQSAVDTAQEEIDAYREDADDGWSDDVQRVFWGVVIQQAQGFDAQNLHTSNSQHTYQTCDYKLVDAVETPATDAWVNEQQAKGIEKFAANERAVAKRYKEKGGNPSSAAVWFEVIDSAMEFAAQLRGSQV